MQGKRSTQYVTVVCIRFTVTTHIVQLKRHLCRRFLAAWRILPLNNNTQSRLFQPWSFLTSWKLESNIVSLPSIEHCAQFLELCDAVSNHLSFPFSRKFKNLGIPCKSLKTRTKTPIQCSEKEINHLYVAGLKNTWSREMDNTTVLL